MKYGYTDNKPALLRRLHRIEGQVRGIERMVEQDTYCIDILTQISAIESAMDKVALELLRDHIGHCLADKTIGPDNRDKKIEEVMAAISRLLAK